MLLLRAAQRLQRVPGLHHLDQSEVSSGSRDRSQPIPAHRLAVQLGGEAHVVAGARHQAVEPRAVLG